MKLSGIISTGFILAISYLYPNNSFAQKNTDKTSHTTQSYTKPLHVKPLISADSINKFSNYISSVVVNRDCPNTPQDGNDLKPKTRLSLKAILSNDSSIHLPNKIEHNKEKGISDVASIYFMPDSFRLTKNDSVDLERIADAIAWQYHNNVSRDDRRRLTRNIKSILVVGRADMTINHSKPEDYNFFLSQNRAEMTADYLIKCLKKKDIYVPRDLPIELVARGDQEPVNTGKDRTSYSLNRTVEIMLNEPSVEYGIKNVRGNEILIDISTSMTRPDEIGNIPKDIVNNHIYNCNYPVNVFVKVLDTKRNKTLHLKDGENIKEWDTSLDAGNDTIVFRSPIAEVALYKAKNMNKGDTLSLISDGELNSPTQWPLIEEAARIAKERGVTISCVSMRRSDEGAKTLRYLSSMTGGEYFIGIYKYK